MARLADDAFLVRAGRQRSVAATKTYTGQLMLLYLLAAALGSHVTSASISEIPGWAKQALALETELRELVERYRYMRVCAVVARGINYANAFELLRDRYGEGGVNQMTVVERRTHLARALGRALAHEIGHYLLASSEHSARGLMKAQLVANDLFGPSRGAFGLTDAQRCDALVRLWSTEHLAKR